MALNALNMWYETTFARRLQAKIAQKLGEVLTKIPAGELLHLGVGGFEETLAGRQRERMIFFTDVACEHLLSAEENLLPLKSETHDCVVLLHALDVATNPHTVLREVSRINSKGGYVVVVGFNLFSSWGLYRSTIRISKWGKQPPWSLQFYSLSRLKDWFALLGYEVGVTQTLNYQPLLQHERFAALFEPVNSLGRFVLPWCGNIYVIVAQKSTLPLTPVKSQWKLKRQPLKSHIAEPSISNPASSSTL